MIIKFLKQISIFKVKQKQIKCYSHVRIQQQSQNTQNSTNSNASTHNQKYKNIFNTNSNANTLLQNSELTSIKYCYLRIQLQQSEYLRKSDRISTLGKTYDDFIKKTQNISTELQSCQFNNQNFLKQNHNRLLKCKNSIQMINLNNIKQQQFSTPQKPPFLTKMSATQSPQIKYNHQQSSQIIDQTKQEKQFLFINSPFRSYSTPIDSNNPEYLLLNNVQTLKYHLNRAKQQSDKLKDKNLKLRLQKVKLASKSTKNESLKLIPLKIQYQNLKRNIQKLIKEKQLLQMSQIKKQQDQRESKMAQKQSHSKKIEQYSNANIGKIQEFSTPSRKYYTQNNANNVNSVLSYNTGTNTAIQNGSKVGANNSSSQNLNSKYNPSSNYQLNHNPNTKQSFQSYNYKNQKNHLNQYSFNNIQSKSPQYNSYDSQNQLQNTPNKNQLNQNQNYNTVGNQNYYQKVSNALTIDRAFPNNIRTNQQQKSQQKKSSFSSSSLSSANKRPVLNKTSIFQYSSPFSQIKNDNIDNHSQQVQIENNSLNYKKDIAPNSPVSRDKNINNNLKYYSNYISNSHSPRNN